MKKIASFLFFFALLLTCHLALADNQLTFQLSGVTGDPLLNATKRLSVDVADAGPLTPATIQALYKNGNISIQKALEPYGYFRAIVTPLKLTHTQNQWTAFYHVHLGKPIYITSLSVQVIGPGKNNPAIVKAWQNFGLHQNEIFNVANYKAARDKLLGAMQSEGYIMSQATTDKVIIHLGSYTTSINMVFDTMQRYYFGPTSFSPNPLNVKFLRRYLNYQPGTPFSAKKIVHLQNNLNNSGYFRAVTVTPQLNQISKNQVPVSVDLTPNKRKLYQFGLGYGTGTGMRVTAGTTWRWVNQWGDKFNANVSWSEVNKNIQAQYLIPAHDPAHDQYAINAGFFTLNPRHGNSTVEKVGVGYLTQYGKWQRSVTLSYQLEHYRVDTDSDTGYQNANVLLPNLTYSWISTSNPIAIKNGARANLSLQGSDKALISSVSFIQAQATGKLITTLFDDNRFIARADFGYTIIQDSDNLPLSLRFYTGGPTSVRGFNIESIGPGRYLTVGSIEYQRRVYKKWYGAVFYDAGNAMNTFDNYTGNLNKSTGLGIIWQTPLGNASFYVAKAISRKGQPVTFDFSLGPDL